MGSRADNEGDPGEERRRRVRGKREEELADHIADLDEEIELVSDAKGKQELMAMRQEMLVERARIRNGRRG